MSEKKDMKFIAFLDENNNIVDGFFEIVEEKLTYIKIKTSKNILTLPWGRILKIKEEKRNGGKN